jgi:tRNA-specific adenosine deaminase 3
MAGRGVFAPIDIPAGTILEESPVLILTQAEWEDGKLDDGVLGGYAFNWSNGGMAIGLGIGAYGGTLASSDLLLT